MTRHPGPTRTRTSRRASFQELEGDERWDVAFARSQGALERPPNEALEEYRAGRTEPLGSRCTSISTAPRRFGPVGSR